MDFVGPRENVIPLWISLPNLPLNCWSPSSVCRIGSLLGVPLFADDCTTNQMRVSFARILIKVDVTKALPDNIFIQDPNGKNFEQRVVYDWNLCSVRNV